MHDDLTATANITINASLAKVWEALINPEVIRRYMFGATVASDWKQGSPITWKGEWKGKPYEDKGRILELRPQARLRYSHFSPLSGVPDLPGNYHNVTVDVSGAQMARPARSPAAPTTTSAASATSRFGRRFGAGMGSVAAAIDAEL